MELLESESVELKAEYTPAVKKEAVAFANSKGGTIYIGVADDGRVTGVQEPTCAMDQLASAIRDGIRPDLSIFTKIELLTLEEKAVIKATILPGTRRPYYLSEKGLRPSGVYLRIGSASAPASEDAIRAMIKMTDGDSFESNRSLVQELSFQDLTAEMKKAGLELSEIQMQNLGLMTLEGIYTNLALLISDQCPYSIKLAVFQGSKEAVFKDRKEVRGSLFAQLNDAYRFIDFYNGQKAVFHGLSRIDVRNFPQEALREVLLNALVHRDYSFSGSTLIHLYSDRLEVISLGGLVPGLSLEALMMGASQSRNEKLADLFYRLKLIESYGTGIRKILNAYEESEMTPLFESATGAFKVTLPNLNRDEQTLSAEALFFEDAKSYPEDRFQLILKLLDNKDTIRRKDVEKALGIGTTHAVNTLKEMLDKKLLIRLGSGKHTRYTKNPSLK